MRKKQIPGECICANSLGISTFSKVCANTNTRRIHTHTFFRYLHLQRSLQYTNPWKFHFNKVLWDLYTAEIFKRLHRHKCPENADLHILWVSAPPSKVSAVYKSSRILCLSEIFRDLYTAETFEGGADTRRFLAVDTRRSAYKKISWCIINPVALFDVLLCKPSVHNY